MDDLPLVIQIGRWRKQIRVPHVHACGQNSVAPALTHLPRNHTEGDIPLIAISTGDSDLPECVLRKIGIDDSEITKPSAGGRIQLYQGLFFNPPTAGPGTPSANDLWGNEATLKKYDAVLLPCNGQDFYPSAAYVKNLIDYTDAGGRIFASHYSYAWLKHNNDSWTKTVSWGPGTYWPPIEGDIDTSFPDGMAMAAWLQNVGATKTLGTIDKLLEPRNDIASAVVPTRTWIRSPMAGPKPTQLSFETPLGVDPSQQCGRVMFEDFHVVDILGGATGAFPTECKTMGPMTPQEKVFEFMFFNLTTCVQPDDEPPKPPR
jgi:hypothetical protein